MSQPAIFLEYDFTPTPLVPDELFNQEIVIDQHKLHNLVVYEKNCESHDFYAHLLWAGISGSFIQPNGC